MKRTKIIVLIAVTLCSIAVTLVIHPVSQPPSFHHFADTRTFLGIPNFWNVVTNLPFVIVGSSALIQVATGNTAAFQKYIYGVLFIGILLTGLGSAHYHLHPDNDTLVWDRIPMTIVFMSFLCTAIAALISKRFAAILFIPLLLIGMGSVLWWHHTESIGHGDLRWYGFVQFYPMLAIGLMIGLFFSEVTRAQIICLIYILLWYLLAKLFEHYDIAIYQNLAVISGHSLKHIAAAIATGYITRFCFRQGTNLAIP